MFKYLGTTIYSPMNYVFMDEHYDYTVIPCDDISTERIAMLGELGVVDVLSENINGDTYLFPNTDIGKCWRAADEIVLGVRDTQFKIVGLSRMDGLRQEMDRHCKVKTKVNISNSGFVRVEIDDGLSSVKLVFGSAFGKTRVGVMANTLCSQLRLARNMVKSDGVCMESLPILHDGVNAVRLSTNVLERMKPYVNDDTINKRLFLCVDEKEDNCERQFFAILTGDGKEKGKPAILVDVERVMPSLVLSPRTVFNAHFNGNEIEFVYHGKTAELFYPSKKYTCVDLLEKEEIRKAWLGNV